MFNCTFKFDEDETLYAIKWYRGTYEIFRYIPSDDPPTKSFPLSGYNISVSGLLYHSIQFSFFCHMPTAVSINHANVKAMLWYE